MSDDSQGRQVTVIIPAYNAEDVLGQQLQALARQTSAPNWEILVADNGSTDRTADVAQSWADKGLPVRVIDASGRPGAAHGRNCAAAVATTPILLFCDADDEVTEIWARELLSGLEHASIAGGRADRRTLNQRGAWTYPKETPHNYPFVGGGNMAIGRHDFQQLLGFDESMIHGGEDIELCYRAQRSGMTVTTVDAVVYRLRARSGLKAAFHQATRDGRGTVHLVVMHGHEIIPKRSPMVLVRKVAWLASRAPLAVVSGPHRTLWSYRIGHLIGLIQGWRLFRTMAW